MKTARFSAAECGQSTLVHDPATGLTHLSEERLPAGRVVLDPVWSPAFRRSFRVTTTVAFL